MLATAHRVHHILISLAFFFHECHVFFLVIGRSFLIICHHSMCRDFPCFSAGSVMLHDFHDLYEISKAAMLEHCENSVRKP